MASVMLEKGKKTTGGVMGQIRHDFRQNKTYSNKDIDLERSNLNQKYGCQTATQAREKFKKYLKEIDEKLPPIRKKQDRKVALEMVFKAPRDNMTNEEETQFFDALYEALEKEYGARVLYGVSHFDEKHTYIDAKTHKKMISRDELHVMILPYVEGKGINMDQFYKRSLPKQLNQIADTVCKELFGYKYQTGDKAKGLDDIDVLKRKSLELTIKQLTKEKEELQNGISSLLVKANELGMVKKSTENVLRKTQTETLKKEYEALEKKSEETLNQKVETIDDIRLKESLCDEYIMGFRVIKQKAKEESIDDIGLDL